MSNIIQEMTELISPSLIKQVAGSLGESESGISKALGGLAPTLLAGLANKSSDTAGFGKIFDMISNKDNHLDLSDVTSIIGAGNKSGGVTDALLSGLLGGKRGGVIDLITSFAGLKRGSSSSLMGMITPMIMSYLGRKILKGGLNAVGLSKLLGGQRKNISKALPAGMSDLIGFSADAPEPAHKTTAHTAPTPPSGGSGGGGGLFKYLVPVLLVAGALFAWRSCGSDLKDAAGDTVNAVESVAGDMAGDAVDAMGNAVEGLGDFFGRTLANGIELNIPKFGVENKLMDFIEGDGNLSKDSWYNFDRLTFATGSANLDSDKSKEQLDNIAEIMKAYPKVAIKLGGYTDNTGSEDANLSLSQSRADNVMAALVARGIDGSRMTSEGYGIAHPVASNDTEEGRAQNRRIAINVTAK